MAWRTLFISQSDWTTLTRAMRGEDDGSWILMPNFFTPDGDGECIAIVTRSIPSVLIFVTHVAQAIDGDDATLNDVRFLADQVKVHLPKAVHPVYYLPCVRVRKGS